MALRKGDKAESDVEAEAHRARPPTGKDEDATHVGRVSPDDALDVGETGAEARSEDG
ncbi:hypothetical protein [Mycolicibacter senuensis]|uniref:Uncharacterized protein n=1 Tax=Mycolicibacter senuensis TaxID=386913 RepID=A0A7I9XER6_9MYCO|nr:hypothetical protein [Mycolicibacter senuensis]MDQ2627803.1 hypothetical protein [Actinomycetota bacterium]GFG68473.1 hypothetical protein MSEN_01930 [Mycolicibacter senuensis]